MKKTEPTPGPWIVKGGAYSTHNQPVRFWETGVLADAGWVAQSNGASIEEADANARLIATAPDGLALAKRVLDYFPKGEIDPFLNCDIEVRQMARDLIAKAEGAQ